MKILNSIFLNLSRAFSRLRSQPIAPRNARLPQYLPVKSRSYTMGIATSAGRYLRNANQAHRTAQNGGCLDTTRLGSSQLRLGQFSTRQIHSVSQPSALSRTSVNPKVLASLVAGNKSALELQRKTIDPRSFTNPYSTRDLSGTTRPRSQAAAVVVEGSSEHGESIWSPADEEYDPNGEDNFPVQEQFVRVKRVSVLGALYRLIKMDRLRLHEFRYIADGKEGFTCTFQCFRPEEASIKFEGHGYAEYKVCKSC